MLPDKRLSVGLPFISVLCATFRRPLLMRNALACYLAQDYPSEKSELLILDDGGDLVGKDEGLWRVYASASRFPSTASKYQFLAQKARGDLIVIWDDDDIYLPWHLSCHVQAMRVGCDGGWDRHVAWSKPSEVGFWPHSAEQMTFLGAAGRFHGATGLTSALLRQVGGWPRTKRADWSLQFLAMLKGVASPRDTLHCNPCPSYVYRWHSPGMIHASTAMSSPEDVTWYQKHGERLAKIEPADAVLLVPEFDAETSRIYERCGVMR